MAKVAAEYIAPNGEFFPGVPDRDLSKDEWEAISPEVRKALLDHGLYRVTGSQSKAEVNDG